MPATKQSLIHLHSVVWQPGLHDSEGESLKGIDLDIAEASVVAIVGPRGSGNRAILGAIAGRFRPTHGELLFLGRPITPQTREIAAVFQNYALYPHLTVRENIAFGLKLQKVNAREIAARVDQALHLLGIEGLADRKPRQLTGDQRKRVAMARAVVRDTKVLLLEDPLVGLNRSDAAQFFDRLRGLRDEKGVTSVFTAAELNRVPPGADQIVITDEGRILADTTRPGIQAMMHEQADEKIAQGQSTHLAEQHNAERELGHRRRDQMADDDAFVDLKVAPEDLDKHVAGSGILAVDIVSRLALRLRLTGDLHIEIAGGGTDLQLRLLSDETRPSSILLPVQLRMPNEGVPAAHVMLHRLSALTALYNILFLLGDGERRDKMDKRLRSDVHSPLVDLLSDDEQLRIASFAAGSILVTVGASIAKAYKTILLIASVIHPLGRAAIEEKLKGIAEGEKQKIEQEKTKTRREQIKTEIQEIELGKKRIDAILQSLTKVKRLPLDHPVRKAVEEHVASLIGETPDDTDVLESSAKLIDATSDSEVIV